jgi:tetratricopeptide (TPR) repeat protein
MRPGKLTLFTTLFLAIALAAGPAWANAASEVNRGLAAHREGELQEALKLYTRAIDSGELPISSLAMAYNNRAALWADMGRFKKAMRDYAMALDLDSTNAMFYTNRGLTYQRWGQYRRALDDYNRALELDDGYPDALQAKAWLMATCPLAALRDGGQAVALASRAVAIRRDANTLDTLAAALAEDRKFTAAVRIQQQALALLRGPGGEDQPAPPGMERRLKLYAARKPYREPFPRQARPRRR